MVVADQVERELRPAPLIGGAIRAGVGGDLEKAVEGAQRTGQVRGAIGGDGDDDDAGELARQLRHLAVLPVATVGGHRIGEGLDEPDTVVTDHGEHERGHERIVTIRRARSPVRRCQGSLTLSQPGSASAPDDPSHRRQLPPRRDAGTALRRCRYRDRSCSGRPRTGARRPPWVTAARRGGASRRWGWARTRGGTGRAGPRGRSRVAPLGRSRPARRRHGWCR